MNDFLIKGTVIYLGYETWKDDPKYFGSRLLTIIQEWEGNTFHPNGRLIIELPQNLSKEYGQIKQASHALSNDFHNLTVNYRLLTEILGNENTDSALKELYLSLLVENYFINVRSIYDYTCFFPRILISERNLDKVPSESLNRFVKFLKNSRPSTQMLDEKVIQTVLKYETHLTDIRSIRDTIIHHGKEPIVSIAGDTVLFRIPKKDLFDKDNMLPNILNCENDRYPLIEYLRVITLRLIEYLENLGNVLIHELHKGSLDTYRPNLVALAGICMKDFMSFLYPNGAIKITSSSENGCLEMLF